jgi:hypothetical protein
MSLKRACIFIVVTAVLVSCQTKRAAQIDVLTVKLDNLIGMEQRRAKWIEMRGFLWAHWAERKPANLFLTTVSKEGRTTHAEYRIALLSGVLMLKVTFVRDRIGYQGQVIPKPEGGYDAYTVERVLSKNPHGVGEDARVTVLAGDALVSPADYWLRFKGWGNALITYF